MKTLALMVLLVVLLLCAWIWSAQAPTNWSVGEVVQTPEARFADLQDYPFAPNYREVMGYRVHYVDEGPRTGPVVLLMHGQPSWSYLYRHMIPPLAAAGYRVIAPDLVGFGKSDKPTKTSDHSYQMHIDVMTELLQQLQLAEITLFAQDWGGLIGLRMVAQVPDRFARIMISNTGLPAAGGIQGWLGYPLFKFGVWREGQVDDIGLADSGFSFTRWVAYAKTAKNFNFQQLFQSATHRELTSAELDGYAAPFPEERYMAAPRIFPYLVPSQLRQNQQVMEEIYQGWQKPFLTAFGDSDPVTAGGDRLWQDQVPGAQGQPHTTVAEAAHFIQEDQPEQLVELLIGFMSPSP